MVMQRDARPKYQPQAGGDGASTSDQAENNRTGLSTATDTGMPLVWRERSFAPESSPEESAIAGAIRRAISESRPASPYDRMMSSPFAQQRAKQMDIMANGGRGGEVLNPALMALFYKNGPDSDYLEAPTDYEQWQRYNQKIARDNGGMVDYPYAESYNPSWWEWLQKYGQ